MDVPPDTQQDKKETNPNQVYEGRITRSKTNSLPQQISRFSSSAIHDSIANS